MKRSWLMLGAVLVAALGAGTPYAQTPSEPESGRATSEPARTESQQFAFDKLMETARFLGKTNRFSVSMRVSYDVVQEDDEKIEFGEQREVLLQRPDKLRIVETASDGEGERVLFDGKTITVFNGDAKVFAQTAQPGTIDDSVVYFVRDLHMRLPVAPMLLTGFADDLQRRITSIDYVGRTSFLGKPAYQIAVRSAQVDFQMWISDAPQPLPLRVVITYRSEPGQPQFRADFSKWNLTPSIGGGDFTFTPPSDARKIAYAAQLMPAQAKAAEQEAPAKQGGNP